MLLETKSLEAQHFTLYTLLLKHKRTWSFSLLILNYTFFKNNHFRELSHTQGLNWFDSFLAHRTNGSIFTIFNRNWYWWLRILYLQCDQQISRHLTSTQTNLCTLGQTVSHIWFPPVGWSWPRTHRWLNCWGSKYISSLHVSLQYRKGRLWKVIDKTLIR